MELFHFEWEAPEYPHRPKTLSWYWISILGAALMLGIAVWQKNFLFAIFIILAEILLLSWGDRDPVLLIFKLNEKGLSVGDKKFHTWHEFKSFSVERDVPDEEDWIEAALFFESNLKTALKIRMSKIAAPKVRDILSQKLQEQKWESSFMDTLERFLGF